MILSRFSIGYCTIPVIKAIVSVYLMEFLVTILGFVALALTFVTILLLIVVPTLGSVRSTLILKVVFLSTYSAHFAPCWTLLGRMPSSTESATITLFWSASGNISFTSAMTSMATSTSSLYSIEFFMLLLYSRLLLPLGFYLMCDFQRILLGTSVTKLCK